MLANKTFELKEIVRIYTECQITLKTTHWEMFFIRTKHAWNFLTLFFLWHGDHQFGPYCSSRYKYKLKTFTYTLSTLPSVPELYSGSFRVTITPTRDFFSFLSVPISQPAPYIIIWVLHKTLSLTLYQKILLSHVLRLQKITTDTPSVQKNHVYVMFISTSMFNSVSELL